ncbi:hypothetical protein GCM10009712_37670 [Pseudarthrobacter sulfonivorans]
MSGISAIVVDLGAHVDTDLDILADDSPGRPLTCWRHIPNEFACLRICIALKIRILVCIGAAARWVHSPG